MIPALAGLSLRHWRAEQAADGVVTLAFDRADARVNSLSQAVLDELDGVLERLAIEPPAGLLIHSAKAAFAAGADLGEFQRFEAEGRVDDAIARGQRVFERLARLPCPTVAAIHGFCMGGGTELALACRWRVASAADDTRIGLPEIKLGIIPGWGGSVRLPRLVGAPAAMDMMLSGRALSARAARAIGLLDAVCAPADLLASARTLLARRQPRPFKQRALAWASNLWPVRRALAPLLLRQVAAKARRDHYPAPFALIESWRRGGATVQAALADERRTVVRLADTPTARNLVRIYFLQERMKALGGGDSGIQRVHVVGAGVMGADIAAWAAYKGFEVSLQDREQRFIDAGLARTAGLFDKKLSDLAQREAAKARLRPDLEGTQVPQADLVIEAIIEDPAAKRELYATLEPRLRPDALLASNTSSIPLDELAAGLQHPAQFAGLHYFNPVAQMPLVEIVRHPGIAADAERRLAAFCKALGKLPLPVAGSPGFLVNRILFPYLLEALTAYGEGIPGAAIDRASKRFGMPMGAIELIDTVGLDVAAGVGRELAPFLGLSLPAAFAQGPVAGQRGKKDGQGLYRWVDGKPLKPALPKGYAAPEDLADRLLLPLINEAVACLHQGVVADADLLDAGAIFGIGFAPFRGGPIAYVRSEGAEALLARLAALEASHGPRFAPRPGWDDPALRGAMGSS
jgi:3-hydroxyacyl-CoA dehydrogenase/enoyl-CoA hydratase/3-hydroxybutyryl-CoA epimerase